MHKKLLLIVALLTWSIAMCAQSVRTTELMDEGWKFSLGNASSPTKDFGRGTEYFNYFTKAHSIHNEGPYILKFDDSQWKEVRLPHDWVTQLPYAPEASHSHGYKTVGYKYPENSVGWYRKVFTIGKEDEGKHFELQFDGIFRDATVWFNGFYMGQEHSGYATQVYDITDYINFGGDNVICVRADATFEEGWFYEGAGIYRDVWLKKMNEVHFVTDGVYFYSTFKDNDDYQALSFCAGFEIQNSGLEKVTDCHVRYALIDAEGNEFCSNTMNVASEIEKIQAKETKKKEFSSFISKAPHLWSCDDPYLYTFKAEVIVDNKVVDEYQTKVGIRDAKFTADKGFILNGKNIKLKGVNMHQDQAGVGAAIPDAIQTYRIMRLKTLGFNAYRASHNPMTPAMLDVCDREGILVIDENRLMGVNKEHLDLLERMIRRDRNHPSIILWSDGNEEWGLENDIRGTKVAASMREYTHRFDPSRMVTVANAGGTELIKGLEVVGYNYIIQNDVDGRHEAHPEWIVAGTEETTACGTRGVYFEDPTHATMPSINRTDTTYENIIERGWKFYDERPWAAGLFYWTGFDYKGEGNPLTYPAVGSEFGILDYCGFDKDEANYLRAWWTDKPVLHIFPHWNLQGHEGEEVSIWAYTNYDEVELFVNGKSKGRQKVEKNGHLKWTATYKPGKLEAVGYKNGKKAAKKVINTTGEASAININVWTESNCNKINGICNSAQYELKADNRDVAVVNIELADKKNQMVPTACNEVLIEIDGPGRILGVGNGNPAFKGEEHPGELDCQRFKVPAFNGLAQVLIQASKETGTINVRCSGEGLTERNVKIVTK